MGIGVLLAPIVLMLIEKNKSLFIQYLIVCVVAFGADGLTAGMLLWIVGFIPRIMFEDVFDLSGLLRFRSND